jgi:cytochrome c oxidase subunit 1
LTKNLYISIFLFYMASTPKFLWEDRFAKVAILFSFVLLALGSLFGLVQALARMPGALEALGLKNIITPQLYYTGLTLHGATNAVLFTAFFIMGLGGVCGHQRPRHQPARPSALS